MTTGKRRVVATALALLGLFAVLTGGCDEGRGLDAGASEESARRFTTMLDELRVDAEAAARIVKTGPGSRPGPESFARLEARRQLMSRSHGGTPSLAVWSLDSQPLCWAGTASGLTTLDEPQAVEYAARHHGASLHVAARVTGPTGGFAVAERLFRPGSRWTPPESGPPGQARFRLDLDAPGLPAPGGTVLLAPDGSRLGLLEPLPPPAGDLSPAWIIFAGLAVVLAALLAAAMRLAAPPRRGSLSQLVGLSAGIWLVRGLLLAAAHPSGGGLLAGLTGAILYASSAPMGLLRSPLDAWLTGLACLAQATLLTRSRPQEHPHRGRVWRLVILTAALAGIAGAVTVAIRAPGDSPLNLLLVAGAPHGLARLALQTGLFLLLWAPCLLLAATLRPSAPVPLRAVVTIPLATVLLFLAFTAGATGERREFVEDNLRPKILLAEAERLHALEESRRALENEMGLVSRLHGALAGGQGDTLAYRLWSRTELARRGYQSSLEIYDDEGHLRGSFGMEMPPPVPAEGRTSENLASVRLDTLVFSTLSQERVVFTSRWLVEDETGVVAGLALFVSNEFENLAGRRQPLPLRASGVSGRIGDATRNALGSDPRVVAYDEAGRLVWSSHIAAPARPGILNGGQAPPEGLWEDALAGDRRVRMFYFSGGNALYGAGFPVASVAEQGGRLLRLLVLTSLFGVALLAAGFPFLAPWKRTVGLLPELLRWMRRSYSRKLAAAVLLASLVPLAGLAIVLRLSLERQRDEILLGLGLRTLGMAEQVVEDAMVAADQEGPRLPDDDTLFWLSRVIRQEIDLFVGGRLAASSRRGLYTSGLLSPLAPAGVYSQIALQGEHVVLMPGRPDERTTTTINASLRTGAGTPAILSLPLHIQKEEVEGRIHEIQQLAELATAAVALLLVATSLLLGRGMSGRIRRLSHATQQLATGDETVRIQPGPADEIGRLSQSFNRMAESLASRRAALQRRTETLEKLIVHAPMGIISLDSGNRVGMLNPAAAKLLPATTTTGIPVEDLLRGSPFGEGLLDLLHRRNPDDTPHQVELSPEREDDRRLRAVLVELPGAAGGRLLLLEDITEAVRSNRLAAWAEMARRIAHEIKNPLTPIRLSAEHLKRVYEQGDPRFEETLARSLETILEQVEALREISSDFSLYARIPAIRRQPVEPGRLVLETLAPYRDAPPPGVRIEQDVAPGLPPVPLDEGLIRRALINLVENALQSMPEGGTLSLSCRLTEDIRQVEIRVSDTGVGMDRDTLRDVFEPYFSTRDAGTGLGLAITRRAVEEHGGAIRVESSPGNGSTFTVLLPTRHERPTTR